MIFKQNKAFTLIEMLIVIVIIGILAAALVPRLQSVQGRARDTKRKADLRQIYNANEIWKIDNGSYIQAIDNVDNCAFNAGSCYVRSYRNQPRISGLQAILTTIPVDPINNTTQPYFSGYSYVYGSVMTKPNFETYDLVANLENAQDPDICAKRRYMYNGKNTTMFIWCGTHAPTLYDVGPGGALSGN